MDSNKLKHIILNKIAIDLWNEPDVRFLIDDCSCITLWREREKLVLEKVSAL